MTNDNAYNNHKHNVVCAMYAINALFILNISFFFFVNLFIHWLNKITDFSVWNEKKSFCWKNSRRKKWFVKVRSPSYLIQRRHQSAVVLFTVFLFYNKPSIYSSRYTSVHVYLLVSHSCNCVRVYTSDTEVRSKRINELWQFSFVYKVVY